MKWRAKLLKLTPEADEALAYVAAAFGTDESSTLRFLALEKYRELKLGTRLDAVAARAPEPEPKPELVPPPEAPTRRPRRKRR